MQQLLSVSVLVPTLNSARTLNECLTAIRDQDYPPNLVEIIVADAGSTDGTVSIAAEFGARVVPNPLVTGEAGKAAALRTANSDLVALVDSDNVMVGRDWLRKMVAPFADASVVGTEPLFFSAQPTDTLIDRYCAIFGVGDPLCLFVGNYDKHSAATGRWTGYSLRTEDVGDYIVIQLDTDRLPTIGANGTVYRRDVLNRFVNDYLMDIDIPILIAKRMPGRHFAKVRVAIRHLYCSDTGAFIRKQRRRVRDLFAVHDGHEGQPRRVYPWHTGASIRGILLFVGSCLTIAPLLYQSVVAYIRSGDKAAFFHPVACWITLCVYGTNFLFARGRSLSRSNWKQ